MLRLRLRYAVIRVMMMIQGNDDDQNRIDEQAESPASYVWSRSHFCLATSWAEQISRLGERASICLAECSIRHGPNAKSKPRSSV